MVAQQLGLSISLTAALVWGLLVCRDECQKWSLDNAEAVMNQWHGHERSRLSDAHGKRKLAQLVWSDRCATVDKIAKLILIERCHNMHWITVCPHPRWPLFTTKSADNGDGIIFLTTVASSGRIMSPVTKQEQVRNGLRSKTRSLRSLLGFQMPYNGQIFIMLCLMNITALVVTHVIYHYT